MAHRQDSLRWDVDSLVTDHFGDRVWLKARFDEHGNRTGITECCFEDSPCQHHAALKKPTDVRN